VLDRAGGFGRVDWTASCPERRIGSVAIAVLPEDPRDRGERQLERIAMFAVGIVVGLFVYAMLDAYIF
jgi:hypothetical protein